MESDKHSGMIELDESTCMQLLQSRHVGRIALNVKPSPLVLPVNYVLSDKGIYFYTRRGAKQKAARGHHRATFQVDEYDPRLRSGWSVMARGVLEIQDPGNKPIRLPKPLPDAEHPYLVRLSIEEITGRKKTKEEGGWVLPTYTWALLEQEVFERF